MAIIIIFDNLYKKKQYYNPIGLPQEINTHFCFTIQKTGKDDSEILSELKAFKDIPDFDFINSLEEKKNKDNIDSIILINEPFLCEQIKFDRKHFCKELETHKNISIYLHQSLIKSDFIPHGIIFSGAKHIDKTFSHEKISDFPVLFKHPLWQRIMAASKKKLLIDLHKTNRYLTNLKYFLEIEIKNKNKNLRNWNDLNIELQMIDPLLNLDIIKNQLNNDIIRLDNSMFIEIQNNLKKIVSILNLDILDFPKLLESIQIYLTKY